MASGKKKSVWVERFGLELTEMVAERKHYGSWKVPKGVVRIVGSPVPSVE